MKLRRRTHPFVEDVDAGLDALRRQWCVCGLPAGNEIHVLPRRGDEERAAETRRMGER